ncbi:MAG: DNA polymerase III subunit beta [Erysipelotrichaceae bacterium]|nr:DNA polymerase III subunit beta [Erysipelotrichaceae bacterium]
MYLRISRRILMDSLNVVSSAVSTTSPLPVLHNIKLSAKDRYLQLTASDSDISIQNKISYDDDPNMEIIREGDVLLDKRFITDIVRKMDSDIIELEIIDGSLVKIRGLAVNFDLNGSNASGYPHIDFTQPEESFRIKADVLKGVIMQTVFACSDKEIKPILTGVNFNCTGNELVCSATDSYRLAQKKTIIDEEHDFNITIPAKSLNEIVKVLSDDSDVTVALNEKKVMFIIGNTVFQSRLIEGSYPEISKLIPSQFDYELVVDARELLNAIDRPTMIKNEGVSIIKMEMNPDEIGLSSRSNEAVYKENIIPISYEGNSLTIAFKANYVFDAIKALNAVQIKISFSGEIRPFILRPTDNDSVLQLVLPIRTYM